MTGWAWQGANASHCTLRGWANCRSTLLFRGILRRIGHWAGCCGQMEAETGLTNGFPSRLSGPQGLKPAFLLAGSGTAKAVPFPKPFMRPALNGTAEEVAEKVDSLRPAPKGASDSDELTVSLKRYPDTRPKSDTLIRGRSFSVRCEAVPYPKRFMR
jgi:hypothetical protein